MIIDGSTIPNGTQKTTQVCIIGSGQAGITAAWQLQKAGIKVILIEGSRMWKTMEESWPDKVLLYNGVSDGLFKTNEPEFLILPYVNHQYPAKERERMYGGTSTHWGGQSRPEDQIDMDARPGFPGWPITRKDLDPFYADASKFCVLHGDYGATGDNFSNEYWTKTLNAQAPSLDGFDVEMYQFMGGSYLNFATRTFDGNGTIGDSPVEVIRNASLLNIDLQQGSVSQLQVASMDATPPPNPPKPATKFTIKADLYVLACGSVANAQNLLLSNAGNENDQVGRYFMCHPLTNGQYLRTTTSPNFLPYNQAKLLNGELSPGVRWSDSNGVQVTGRFIPNAEQTTKLGIGRCWFWYVYGQYYFEQSPNRDSRITLTDTLDPVFQLRQARATWMLNDTDQKTYEQTTKLFQTAVSNLGGSFTYPTWDFIKSTLVVNGHHMGTTRMSSDPKEGVVDKNLKVHSLKNLYVAGASVFPSGGISNPTFTIITLSIRLAAYLKQQLTGS